MDPAPADDRQREIARQIAEVVSEDAAEASRFVADLRDEGVMRRPTYRLTSPHGSGMSQLAEVTAP
jgi:hypothetical protein